MTATAAAPPRPADRLLPAGGIAGVAFLAIWQGTAAAGYGADAHAGRVVATLAVLFAGAAVACKPGRRGGTRAAVLLITVAVAAELWWFLPAAGGLSLARAAELRAEVTRRLAAGEPDATAVGEVHPRLTTAAEDFPELMAPPQARLRAYADRVARRIADRYRATAPDDLATARVIRRDANLIEFEFPEFAARFTDAEQDWVEAACRWHVGGMAAIPPGEDARYAAGVTARQALAVAFPEAGRRLADGEKDWGRRAAADVADQARKLPPKQARELCREALRRITTLPALVPPEARFRAARRLLYDAAFDAAKTEARQLLDAGRVDEAFGVLRGFAVEWFDEAENLGTGAELAALRDAYRYLAGLAARGVPAPDTAPAPRAKD